MMVFSRGPWLHVVEQLGCVQGTLFLVPDSPGVLMEAQTPCPSLAAPCKGILRHRSRHESTEAGV